MYNCGTHTSYCDTHHTMSERVFLKGIVRMLLLQHSIGVCYKQHQRQHFLLRSNSNSMNAAVNAYSLCHMCKWVCKYVQQNYCWVTTNCFHSFIYRVSATRAVVVIQFVGCVVVVEVFPTIIGATLDPCMPYLYYTHASARSVYMVTISEIHSSFCGSIFFFYLAI